MMSPHIAKVVSKHLLFGALAESQGTQHLRHFHSTRVARTLYVEQCAPSASERLLVQYAS